jgi:hypothetical protein
MAFLTGLDRVLSDVGQAALAHMRDKRGITASETAAREAELSQMVKRAQAQEILQRIGMKPAEQESEITHRTAQTELAGAQAEAARALAGKRADGPPPPDVGGFEDYVTQKYGPRPSPEQIAEARKTYMQADDRPASPRISLELPVQVRDKTTGQTTWVSKRDLLAAPDRYVQDTTAQRNEASGSTAAQQGLRQSRARAVPVLQDLGSRALTINRGSQGGIMARAGGAMRSGASRVGMDSAVDLYRTGIRGFVPLLARSVGHVGVLTEQDVQRTEELFPRVGDSEAVTLEKISRIKRITTGQEPMPFEFEQPEYNDAGITVPGSQSSPEAAPGGTAPMVQRNKRTGAVRHSLDGGATWQPGPPQ